MLKLNPRGTAEMIETLLEALKASPNVQSVEHSDFSKLDPDYKTGSMLVFVKFKQVISKTTLDTKIYERRHKGQRRSGPEAKAGYVYLLQAANGTWKIGKTTNPKSRKKTFNVRLPFAVEFNHIIETDDMSGLEKGLHKLFTSKRLNGSEFFSLSDVDVQFIVGLGSKCTLAQFQAKLK